MDIKFWENERGDAPAWEFINELEQEDDRVSAKVFDIIGLLREKGLRLCSTKYAEPLRGHPLYELRIQFSNNQYRIFFDVADNTAWLFHGFVKKTQKTPTREINTALKRRATIKQFQ